MKAFKALFIFLILSGSSVGFDDLQLGVETKNTQEMSDSEFIDFTLKTRKAADFGIKGSQVSSFIEVEDRFYALLKDMRLIGMIEQPKEFLGNWPLTRWALENEDPEVSSLYEITDIPFELDAALWNGYGHNRHDSDPKALACLPNHPLRYGEVNSSGQAHLALYLGFEKERLDWVLFSPERQRIDFSARLIQNDTTRQASNQWQYVSGAKGRNGGSASRAYAKLYFDDFDDNGQPDILVWRKRYESRSSADPVLGYELTQEVWRHYQYSDEGYQLVETDEATIQGWLADKELTWSQGYPRYSECEGEEGQLIPEMHDALLNDPDVLM